MAEDVGIRTRFLRQADGTLCLGVYCAQCNTGIVLVVLGPEPADPSPAFDWERDKDVRRAVENHRKLHNQETPLP